MGFLSSRSTFKFSIYFIFPDYSYLFICLRRSSDLFKHLHWTCNATLFLYIIVLPKLVWTRNMVNRFRTSSVCRPDRHPVLKRNGTETWKERDQTQKCCLSVATSLYLIESELWGTTLLSSHHSGSRLSKHNHFLIEGENTSRGTKIEERDHPTSTLSTTFLQDAAQQRQHHYELLTVDRKIYGGWQCGDEVSPSNSFFVKKSIFCVLNKIIHTTLDTRTQWNSHVKLDTLIFSIVHSSLSRRNNDQ